MAALENDNCNNKCVECGLTIDEEEELYLREERDRMKSQNKLSKRDMLNICVICWQETHSSPGDTWDGLESCTDRFSELNEGRSLKVPEDVFVCHVCNNTFPDLNTLNIHERTHERMKKIICPWCKAVFPNGDIFGEHMKNNHTFHSTSTFVNIAPNIENLSGEHKTKMKKRKKKKGTKSLKKYDNIWDNIYSTFMIPENPKTKAKNKLVLHLIKCEKCSFVSKSKDELKIHVGKMHVVEKSAKKRKKIVAEKRAKKRKKICTEQSTSFSGDLPKMEGLQAEIGNCRFERQLLTYVKHGNATNFVNDSRDCNEANAINKSTVTRDFSEGFLQGRRDDVRSECANDGDGIMILSDEEDVSSRQEECKSKSTFPLTVEVMDANFRRPKDTIKRPLNRRFTIDKNKRLKVCLKR